ncbi:MAG: hypothetical protein IIC49_04675, partial [Planctomycetes bacterium]|nr:hypothetical protein [Planctomycetota bacterium]
MQVETAPCGLLRRWLVGSAIDADTPGDLEPLVRRVLASRGLGDSDQADAFLSPSLLDQHDPSLIPDLDRPAERLLVAAR